MNNDVVIKVDNVKKYFKVYPDKGKTLKDKVLFHKRNRFEKREVLKGISFEVKRGEAIGLIGKNGCGKSTTLKLLTRILRPNEGTITIDGRVSSLIELGAGFHPDLTGRENIYINASIFGITAKEVDERLDDIIRFSELEEYIDNPVRTYSSGMYMRLAFSVAINVDADILLIDEILAVGDMNFQEKCFQKLQEIKRNGTTIVIVSHAQGQIEKICDRCIWIEKGEIRSAGNTKQVLKEYEASMDSQRIKRAKKEADEQLEKLVEEEERIANLPEEQLSEEDLKKKKEREQKIKNLTCREICKQCGAGAHREGTGAVEFTEVVVNGAKEGMYYSGDIIRIRVRCKNNYFENPQKVIISVGITRDDWVYCFGTSTLFSLGYVEIEKEKIFEFELKNRLITGNYFLDIIVQNEQGEQLDALYSIVNLRINSSEYKQLGIVRMDYSWKTEE